MRATSNTTEIEDRNQDKETKVDKATATTERAKTIVVIERGWARFLAANALVCASGHERKTGSCVGITGLEELLLLNGGPPKEQQLPSLASDARGNTA